jgi:hypothetical protein
VRTVTTRRARRATGCVLACFLLSVGLAAPANAEYGIASFDGQVTANPAGDPSRQAGAHPYALSMFIGFNTVTDPIEGPGWPEGSAKNVIVDAPPGVVGNPTAVEQCTMEQLADSANIRCPSAAQIGVARVELATGFGAGFIHPRAIYSMVPPPDVPARFGFNVFGTVILLDATVRNGSDYGLSIVSKDVPQGIATMSIHVTMWGFPADPAHDGERACVGLDYPDVTCASQASNRPFLRNPTACTPEGQGLVTTLRTDSWEHPGDFKTASFTSHFPPGLLSDPPEPDPSLWGAPQGPTGCGLVPFDATFTATPASSPQANEPSGFSFDLSIPQNDDAIGQSDLRKAVVTLPAGVRVSPPSAHGLAGCAPEQIKLGTTDEPSCPDASKVGSLTLTTPLLEEPLTGSVYLATPMDNPFGSLLAIYIVARGPGLTIKLAGHVEADPGTGQLTTTFDDNPQLPFSNLHLEFDDGPRAPLVLPRACGTYTTRAVLTGWSGKATVSESSFTIARDSEGQPCSGSTFTPSFEAGTMNPVAGKHTSFVLQLSRDDVDEELRTVSVETPTGIIARIKGVPKCPAAQAALGNCGEDSRVGKVIAGAGAGENPFFVEGDVYFSGPYKGAPFSLAIVVPVVAGPFDLGKIVVRSAIHVDRRTAALRVVSDPIPSILQGIPLQARVVRVEIDRDRFILNPTSCTEKSIRATVGSTEGSTAHVGSRFQVGECAQLGLRPRISFRVGAKGRTGAGASVPLVSTIRQAPGQAGLKSVGVTLPLLLNARLAVVEDACTQEQFDAGDCENARTGRVVVTTPLLDEPLRGGAYFVERASGRGLPNLVLALRGEVNVDLVGTVKIPSTNRLSTRFRAVPDVPFSSFKLRLFAGRNGALGTTASLCGKTARGARAKVAFRGQNGRRLVREPKLVVRGCHKDKR